MKKIAIIFMLLLPCTQLLSANTTTDFKQTVVNNKKKEKTDPVCRMKINTRPTTASNYKHEKVDYAFCSEACKKNFVEQPSIYLKIKK